ncbi:MAG: flavin-containing monooxygenase [Acidimicrobiia bacterium]
MRIAILGAGAGGIAAAIKLKQAGYRNLAIFEKRDGFGGTWRDNSYPGAACDVPSHLYSYSFELNPNWSATYASQPEILRYLERCATKYGLRPHLHANTAIVEARWSDAESHWELTAESGERFVADVLISGLGMLNVPSVPDIPGRERFAGPMFHSARWNHDVDLAGKRVAAVGTGASAIQFVPAIVDTVGALTVFQRSPVWVSPRFEQPFTADEQRVFARRPWKMRRLRWKTWWTYERASFRADSKTTELQTAFAASYLERKVADPELRAKLTPDHPVGCKRPLTSRTWYPALQRRNARVVTEAITEMTESGVVTADGTTHDVDVIIWGTGFHASEYLSAIDIYGRNGRRLHDDWQDGAEAYLGTSVTGYPNLFVLYGPNTNGFNSVLFVHEAQAHFIVRALRSLRRHRKRSLDVKSSTQRRYNRRLQHAMRGTVWLAGCHNYFAAPNGKIVTQMPFSGGKFWLLTRRFPRWRYRMR